MVYSKFMYIESIPKNSCNYINDAWDIKCSINEEQELLKQKQDSFDEIYRQSKVYIAKDYNGVLIGYACLTDNNYLSFLAVDLEHQRTGLGRSLIKEIKKDYKYFYCHARLSNNTAYEFYIDLEFNVEKIVESYYKNSEDAYVLEYIDEDIYY